MKIRAASIEDAPALGRVMVSSWLSAHRGQMPDAAWQKRVHEWTPDVSERAWVRLLGAQADGNAAQDVMLVAEDDSSVVVALVLGSPSDDPSVEPQRSVLSTCRPIGTAEVSAQHC